MQVASLEAMPALPGDIGKPATDPKYPDLASQKIAEEIAAEKKPADPQQPAEPAKPAEPAPAEPVKPAEPAKPAETPAEPVKPADKPADPKPRDPKDSAIIALKRKDKENEKAIETLTQQLKNLTQDKKNDPAPNADQEANAAEAKKNLENKIKEIAEAHAVSPELLTAITDLVKQSGTEVQLDPSVMEVINKAKEKQAKEAEQADMDRIVKEEDARFDTEFTSDIANDADLTKEIEVSGLSVSAVKAKLYDFLYSEAGHKYATVPLKEIFQLKKSELLPPKKKSAESGGGTPVVPGESGGEQSIEALKAKLATTPAGPEFEKLSNKIALLSKSSVMRGGKRVNQAQ